MHTKMHKTYKDTQLFHIQWKQHTHSNILHVHHNAFDINIITEME